MAVPAIPPTAGAVSPRPAMNLERAAVEFEAMMIAELLKAARQAGETFGERSETVGAESYREFADEHLARVMADRGALGLARLIVARLDGEPPGAAPASSRS